MNNCRNQKVLLLLVLEEDNFDFFLDWTAFRLQFRDAIKILSTFWSGRYFFYDVMATLELFLRKLDFFSDVSGAILE